MSRIKKYSGFVNENMDQARSLIAKKMAAFDKLKNLLSKNLGYIGKFTEYLMHENIKYEDLVELYNQILDLKSKNATIDISKLSYEKALDKIVDINNDLQVNSLISQFPGEQKKFAKEILKKSNNNYNWDFSTNYNIFLKVSKKEDIKTFISKVSRYKTKDDLLKALKVFSKDAQNSKEQVKELLSNMKSEIVFENDKILVVKVDSIEDIKVLGSDTSWCILGHAMWNRYTKNRLQYIVYDYERDEYDPKFKIGFTLNKDSSIHAAHDILDNSANSVLKKTFEENNLKYKDVLPRVKEIETTDINSISSKTGVESLKQLADDIPVDNKEVISSLIVRLFDVFGYRRASKTGIVNKEITVSRTNILTKLINKYFSGINAITLDNFKGLDERVIMYVKEKGIMSDRFVNPTKFNFSLNSDALSINLDLCPDQALIDANFSIHDFVKYGNKDYTKPIPDDKLEKSREVSNKLFDRMCKIYTENKVVYNDGTRSNGVRKDTFELKMAYLGAILGRKEDCPDYEEIVKRMKPENRSYYSGLFTTYIDISETYIRFDNSNSKFPIELVEVKDYPESKVYISKYGLLNQIPKLLEHLKGKQLTLNVRRDDLKNDFKYRSGTDYEAKLTPDALRVYNLLLSFPQRVYLDTFKVDGNLKVIVK
jgi:hypothetical protein